jgi:hypothetical protein
MKDNEDIGGKENIRNDGNIRDDKDIGMDEDIWEWWRYWCWYGVGECVGASEILGRKRMKGRWRKWRADGPLYPRLSNVAEYRRKQLVPRFRDLRVIHIAGALEVVEPEYQIQTFDWSDPE